MMRKIFTPAILILSLLSSFSLLSQSQLNELPPLSKADQQKLSKLPEFSMPEANRNRTLPYMIDNSSLNYFRPLIAQVGLECGQASSIGIMFTYELNCLRNANGSLPENQIPTHFAYNFLNNGSDAGVNYYETFEIIRHAGSPTVADYGGMSQGGPSRWISGYDNYLSGMHNRIHQVYSIKTNTVEGLNTLKNWIYDHADGSNAGGLASFYAEFNYPPTTLDEGTPEAGKHVIIQWGNSANHAMTIVGYNDSIRYDYNNDGQYTNDIDINADGVVDISDWEIGGFKMANTYGSISGWGDDGFAYMMYKTVADRFQQGGIWDNRVVIVDAKENHEPKLTAKVHLSHNCRNKLKVSVGMSTDMQADEAEFILDYPVFDFQGGCKAMQGNSGIEEIEFGLDLNLLLMHLESGQEARFFLIVHEDDPMSQSSGTVHSFSLMDYNGIPAEISSTQTEVPIENNSTTTLTVDAPITFDEVVIEEENIPALQLYQPYEAQLNASGGTPPYFWSMVYNYANETSSADFPEENEQRLTPSNNNDGTVAVSLPFPFTFYGETYEEVFMSVDGFLRFEAGLSPWPYYIDGRSYLKQNKLIAACFSKPFYVVNSDEHGLWYAENEDYVSFRWKLSVSGQSGNSDVNMIVRLYAGGEIEFYYGEHNAASYIQRYGGISAGDGENFTDLNPVGTYKPVAGQKTTFQLTHAQEGIKITEDGLLTAVIEDYVEELAFMVQARDQNNIRSQLMISSPVEGVRMEFTPQSGLDQQIDFGETFALDIMLENLNDFQLSEGSLLLQTSDPHFTVEVADAPSPALNINEISELSQLFEVVVSHDVPNNYEAEFSLELSTAEGQWTRPLKLRAYQAELQVVSLLVDDEDNGILDPGETAQLAVNIHNNGGSSLYNPEAVLSCSHPDLTITEAVSNTEILPGNGDWEALFVVELDEDASPMEILELELYLSADRDFVFEISLPLMTSLLAENFETANFMLFNWEMEGQEDWFITDEVVFEGNYAARSGVIGDDFFSALTLDYAVAYDDSISFYYKVSSEASYDFLKFNINGQTLLNISGEQDWTKASFPVSQGDKVFSWSYEKDYSISNGSDCAWLDYIIFPARTVVTGTPTSTEKSIVMNINPNPVAGKLSIQIESPLSEPLQLIIFNQHGHQVYQQSFNVFSGSKRIVITDEIAAAGIYTVRLTSKNQSIVKQLIKL
ncbi:MAG: T9SS type A sorting domain-containing protein [Bacteroidetes bacterium]|nr:T9SS type A sorting domain-containing protein [Bacteroidota bacterium]